MIYSYLFEVPDNQWILISTMSEAQFLTMGSHRRTSFTYTPCFLGSTIAETTYCLRKDCGTRCKHRILDSSSLRIRLRGHSQAIRPTQPTLLTVPLAQPPRRPRTLPKPRTGSCRATMQNPICSCPSQLPRLHPAILLTCRQICAEATPCLYEQHTFEFGNQFEAAAAFFRDRSPYSASALRTISLRVHPTGLRRNFSVWMYLCEALTKYGRVQRLELIVETDHPHKTPDEALADGCRPLTESDMRLLFDLQHTSVDWVAPLSEVQGIEELNVLALRPDKAPVAHHCVEEGCECADDDVNRKIATCMSMSESVEGGLATFLRKQLGITS